MEDPKKVQAKIDELNAESAALYRIMHVNTGDSTALKQALNPELVDIWEAVEKYQGLMLVDLREARPFGENYPRKFAEFYQNSGVPVKVFHNKKTGEMRIFKASDFEKE